MIELSGKQKAPLKKKAPRKITGRRQPIIPTAIYDRRDAAIVIGCSVITLIRAYEAGHLKNYISGRYIKHSGKHLLDWLEAGGKTGWHKKEEGIQ